MSKSRIKISAPAIHSRAEMETLVGDIAQLKIEEAKEKASLDEQLKKIRDTCEESLARIAAAIAPKMECARAWAEANPTEFAGLKSVEMLHGVVGWRIGQPTLKPLSGWTWDRVLETVKLLPRQFAVYLRLKEEVNKQAILTDRETLGAEGLRKLGLKVLQEESFFVEPKLTGVEKRETVEAA